MKEMKEQVKPITITDTDSGMKYVLEFSRSTVKRAEQLGFSISALSTQPITAFGDLWYYAFWKNHSGMTRKKADELLDAIGGVLNYPDGLLERLILLYQAPFEVLTDDEGGAGKNPRVTVDF